MHFYFLQACCLDDNARATRGKEETGKKSSRVGAMARPGIGSTGPTGCHPPGAVSPVSGRFRVRVVFIRPRRVEDGGTSKPRECADDRSQVATPKWLVTGSAGRAGRRVGPNHTADRARACPQPGD